MTMVRLSNVKGQFRIVTSLLQVTQSDTDQRIQTPTEILATPTDLTPSKCRKGLKKY